MSVRIGHASIDEDGKATGGAAGDQTGKEVKISSWYNGGWGFVARAKNPAVAEAIAAAAEAGCNNPNIGYDQYQRNTLMTQAKGVNFDLAKISVPCEADCSSFVSVCVRAALGKDFYSGNAPTTSTLKTVLKNTGAFEILTDSKYLTSDKYLKRGDILDRPGKHVVMALDDGTSAKKLSVTSATNSGTTTIKKGDIVHIAKNSTYCNDKDIPDWVVAKTWIVAETPVGDRVVINKSVDGKHAINSPVHAKFLTVVKADEPWTPKVGDIVNYNGNKHYANANCNQRFFLQGRSG